jgi:3-carboxy-cis,cis-muconate cycloisomerase
MSEHERETGLFTGSVLFGGLWSDGEVAELLADRALIGAMLEVEAVLAEAGQVAGLVPAAAAAAIAATARGLDITPEMLAAATARDGVPIPALVQRLRRAVTGEAAGFVHLGATSQDVLDSAMMRQAGQVLAVIDRRVARLTALADAHRATMMAGRTRGQIALPVPLGLRIAGWAAPLIRHRRRLTELRPRLLVATLGGPVGSLSCIDPDAAARLEAEFADRLGLTLPPMPGHAQRDGMAELGSWLSLVAGALGKIGTDLLVMARSEIAEVRIGGAGGSSAMPHKRNPVRAELLVAAAREVAGRLGALHGALIHAEERDGAAWTAEWQSWPAMAVATAAALNHADGLLDDLEIDAPAMQARAGDGGDCGSADRFIDRVIADAVQADGRLSGEGEDA